MRIFTLVVLAIASVLAYMIFTLVEATTDKIQTRFEQINSQIK